MSDPDQPVERQPGRRPVDTAPLVMRWGPYISIVILIAGHLVYVTRWGSGLETTVSGLVQTVAKLEAKVDALTQAVAQGSVPSAQLQIRVEFLERQANENRQGIADLQRRVIDNERGLSGESARRRADRER